VGSPSLVVKTDLEVKMSSKDQPFFLVYPLEESAYMGFPSKEGGNRPGLVLFMQIKGGNFPASPFILSLQCQPLD